MYPYRSATCARALMCVAILTTACGQAGGRGGPTEAGAIQTATEAPAAPDSVRVQSNKVRTPQFGKAFAYPDGLTIEVSESKRFSPSPWVERRPGRPMYFKILVRNVTEEEWNPSQLHVTLVSGFQPATQIYDADQGIVARPEERLKPGSATEFNVGYWVVDPEHMTLEFAPGLGYQSTTVTN